MVVRLTVQQFGFLLAWGCSHGLTTGDRAAKLLLDILLEVRGAPDKAQAASRKDYWPKGGKLPKAYTKSVKIIPYGRSRGTRALWFWGAERGENSISGSFRALVDLLEQAWDLSQPVDHNLPALMQVLGANRQQRVA